MVLFGTFQLPDRQVDVDVAEGCTISQAADLAGIMLDISCAEQGTCGGCAVDLLSGEFEVGGERVVIRNPAKRRVLGCQTRILSDHWCIGIPRRSLVEVGEKVLVDFELPDSLQVRPTVRKVYLELPTPTMEDSIGDFERICRGLLEAMGIEGAIETDLDVLRALPGLVTDAGYNVTATLGQHGEGWRLISLEAGDTSAQLYGVAVDIGTTTVVCSLVDLTRGRLLYSVSCYNQQIRRADDVASRIVHSGRPGGLAELRQLVVASTVNRLIQLLCEKARITSEQIPRLVVSGNTIMSHLFLGLDPANMGSIPFQPVARAPGTFRAREIGVGIHPGGLVDVVPSISAYVGGDLTSDTHVAGVAERDERSILLDLGTNGEIVVCDHGRMLASATAAGPAFEGGRIGCGMRASTGAIEHVRIDPETLVADVDVIGENGPVGICGSGLIDVIAEARRVGLMDESGRFDPTAAGRGDRLREVATDQGRCLGYVVVPREETEDGVADIVVDERDIATLLQAKAATYAGITILLRCAELEASEVDVIYLAGGFAGHIDLRNAIAAGLLPDVPLSRYRVIGNGSLAGAVAGLVDREAWTAFREIVCRPTVVELNTVPEFQEEYVNAMFVPNVMADRFPSVAAGT